MDWKTLASGVLIAFGLTLTGCGDDGGGGPTDGGDGIDGGGHTFDPRTEFFVINDLGIARPDGEGQVEGFDLDDRVSDENDIEGCCQPDFTAPDGRMGIDNQLAELVGPIESFTMMDLDAELDARVADGTVLILAEVENVTSYESDDSVQVNILLGVVPEGSTLETEGGTIAPGQTFDIDARSFEGMMPLVSVEGRIEGGTLTAGPLSALSVPLPIEGADVELTIRRATMEAEILTSGSGSDARATGLGSGVIGGQLNIDELISLATSLGIDDEEMARNLLSSQADLDPELDGDMCPVCNAISVALVLAAVDAERGEVVEVDAGPGMDGGTGDAGTGDAGTGDAGTGDAGTGDAGTDGGDDAGMEPDAGADDAGLEPDAGDDAG